MNQRLTPQTRVSQIRRMAVLKSAQDLTNGDLRNMQLGGDRSLRTTFEMAFPRAFRAFIRDATRFVTTFASAGGSPTAWHDYDAGTVSAV
jgi:hypothetical protein